MVFRFFIQIIRLTTPCNERQKTKNSPKIQTMTVRLLNYKAKNRTFHQTYNGASAGVQMFIYKQSSVFCVLQFPKKFAININKPQKTHTSPSPKTFRYNCPLLKNCFELILHPKQTLIASRRQNRRVQCCVPFLFGNRRFKS